MDQKRPLQERRAFDHLVMIKAHMISLDNVLKGLTETPFSPMSVVKLRHGFNDIRMVIEELMLLSVSAHKDAGETITRGLRNEYHAVKKMRQLAELNPRFFPDAIEVVPSEEEGIAGQFVDVTDEHLSEADAREYYDRCGDNLHASWKMATAEGFASQTAYARRFFTLTSRLLTAFEVDISGQGYIMLGHLNLETAGMPDLFFARNEPPENKPGYGDRTGTEWAEQSRISPKRGQKRP